MRKRVLQGRGRFNADESIEELLRLNQVCHVHDEGNDVKHYAAVPPAEASEHLSLHWRQILLHRVDGRIQHIA